jgi:hypothetical protein
MSAFQKHLDAIRSGKVEKTNVIGLRKALNSMERASRGLSPDRTTPLSAHEYGVLCDALTDNKPRVIGEMHKTGLKLLQSKRYRRQLESVSEIVSEIVSFHLVGFDIDESGHATPVFRAKGKSGKSFPYICRSWQAGGNGPEIVSANYY